LINTVKARYNATPLHYIGVFELKRISRERRVASTKKERNTYRILASDLEGKRPFEIKGTYRNQ